MTNETQLKNVQCDTDKNRSIKMTKTKTKTKTKKSTTADRAVLVTTAHRGVFFGYASDVSGATIKLRAGRLCVYWSTAMKGFMGLASMGPDAQCKIGPASDIELRDITAVVSVTPDAVARWEVAPWA